MIPMSRQARYLVKRREVIGKVPTRYGSTLTYGKWITVGSYATLEEAQDHPRAPGLYDWGVFYRGRRLP